MTASLIRRGRLAPADRLRLTRGQAGYAGLRVIGVQLGPGVVEAQSGRGRRVNVLGGQVVDRVDTVGRHLARALPGTRAERAVGDEREVRAAAVNGDHNGLAAGCLQRLGGAFGRRFVDRVDQVDARILLQAGLHRGLARRDCALGRKLTADLVGAALAAGVLAAGRLLAVEARTADRDPHAFEEAVVTIDIDRHRSDER